MPSQYKGALSEVSAVLSLHEGAGELCKLFVIAVFH
mgnify:CR=1 FL=1